MLTIVIVEKEQFTLLGIKTALCGLIIANCEFSIANCCDPPNAKQIQILRLLAGGLSYEDIAIKMLLALSTVKTHVSVLYSKWNVKNRAEAIKKGSMLGYLDYASVVNEGFQGE